MRYLWLVVVAAALAVAEVAEVVEEPWVEEEELEEPYDEYEPERRTRRDVHDSGPYDEHVRVKRCEENFRERRSADSVRTPRQVHQYEVHENNENDEPSSYPSPAYEEMLAASADHYHMYQAPGARYTEVSAPNNPVSDPVLVAPDAFQANTQQRYNAVQANPSAFRVAPVSVVPAPDLTVAAGHHHSKHHRGHEAGAGRSHQAAHHAGHGGKSNSGYSSDHYVDKGGKGFKTDHRHRKEYEEAAGKRRKHHDNADHKGSHEEQAHGLRGAKFDEKKGHKKGHKTKGYHNKYHKDEFHKEHKFYDDYHKSGQHHRYGKFNAKHASNERGKKKAHHINAGHDVVERGKKGYSNKGHLDSDHKGYRSKSGHEEHHADHGQSGKKGGKKGGSQWGYAKN